MANELMNPCAVFEEHPSPLSPRPPALGPETTVGLFVNDKKNADVLLEHLRRGLAEAHGVRDFRWFMKEASTPAVFTDEFVRECDAVVGAVCD